VIASVAGVWTGTDPDGTAYAGSGTPADYCNDWTSGVSALATGGLMTQSGDAASATLAWTDNADSSCASPFRLYCVEDCPPLGLPDLFLARYTPIQCLADLDCDDGLFCNGEESCAAGLCLPGIAPACDDGYTCSADSCNEEKDLCVNDPLPSPCELFGDGLESEDTCAWSDRAGGAACPSAR